MTGPDVLVAIAVLIYLTIFATVVAYVLDELALTRQTKRDEPRYDDAWFAAKSEAEKRAGAERLWDAVSETPVYDELAVETFRRQLDEGRQS